MDFTLLDTADPLFKRNHSFGLKGSNCDRGGGLETHKIPQATGGLTNALICFRGEPEAQRGRRMCPWSRSESLDQLGTGSPEPGCTMLKAVGFWGGKGRVPYRV